MATVTADQQRAQAKAEYDAFLAACPSRKLLDRLADKWVTLILAALGSDGSHQPGTGCAGEPRSMRYSELARLLAGVSPGPRPTWTMCSPTAPRTTPAPAEPGSRYQVSRAGASTRLSAHDRTRVQVGPDGSGLGGSAGNSG
jgi:hypothetical protein